MSDLLSRLQTALADTYAIERELGRGGMATVFLGRDRRLDRLVAVKVLHADLAQALGAERFRREIEIATRLSHPHILPLYDSGDASGLLYYVMPYVTGESLRARLQREQQLGVEEAIGITCEVAAALDYAHRQGVVHRDIKPENILLADGHAVVADFGIARAISASHDEKLTQTGVTLGTPMYMSPEQACAEPDIDGRSDQYSLAAVTYEMLAGQPPFVGPTAQAIIARQMLDQVPSLTIVRRTIPLEVEDAVLRALSKVRADRFPTVAQFAEALRNPSGTRSWRTETRATTARRPWSPARRRALFAAWALAFVSGGAGLGYAAWRAVLHPGKATAAASYAAGALDPRHVAVLYFEDESRDGSLGYLADGLTEALIGELSRAQALDVVSANGVARHRGADVADDAARDSLAKALGVGTIVRGSVEPAGRGYRVVVRLTDAESGADYQRLSFDQPPERLVEMRDSLVASVAALLRERLGQEIVLRQQRAGTQSADAWAFVQRAERARKEAQGLLADDDAAGAARRFAAADSVLARAEALDPRWAEPPILRGGLALQQAKVATEPATVSRLIAAGRADAERALALDARSADALELRGSLDYLRFLRHLEPDPTAARRLLSGAEADLKAAVEIAPSHANAWQVLSHLYAQIPDFTRVKLAAQRAYEEDAYLAAAPDVIWRLYTASYELEQLGDAEHWCEEGRRRFAANPRFTECRLWILTMRDAPPDVAAAWSTVDALRAMTPRAAWELGGRRYRMAAAAVIARANLPDSARHVLVAARAGRDVDPEHELESVEAFVRGLLGDKDEAFRLLRAYYAANPEHVVSAANDNAYWWRTLRDDPRYKEFRRQAE
ncbi:MAG: protein kinase domain-containing protein [Gemmatimonadaceae bacterium]